LGSYDRGRVGIIDPNTSSNTELGWPTPLSPDEHTTKPETLTGMGQTTRCRTMAIPIPAFEDIDVIGITEEAVLT
jgi:hypothetical protein